MESDDETTNTTNATATFDHLVHQIEINSVQLFTESQEIGSAEAPVNSPLFIFCKQTGPHEISIFHSLISRSLPVDRVVAVVMPAKGE